METILLKSPLNKAINETKLILNLKLRIHQLNWSISEIIEQIILNFWYWRLLLNEEKLKDKEWFPKVSQKNKREGICEKNGSNILSKY